MENLKRYMISIVGEQTMDGETDRIEVLTAGKFIKKNDRFYIGYREYDEKNPNDWSDNLIKVDKNTVIINRKGQLGSQLMLEKGRRHQCIYSTIAGDMSIGVFTKTLENKLHEKLRAFMITKQALAEMSDTRGRTGTIDVADPAEPSFMPDKVQIPEDGAA